MSVKYPGSTSELQPTQRPTLWVLQLHTLHVNLAPLAWRQLHISSSVSTSIIIPLWLDWIRVDQPAQRSGWITMNSLRKWTFQKCHPKICKSSDMKVKHAESRSCWDLTNKSALNPHLPRRNPAPLQTGYLLKLLHLTSVKRQRGRYHGTCWTIKILRYLDYSCLCLYPKLTYKLCERHMVQHWSKILQSTSEWGPFFLANLFQGVKRDAWNLNPEAVRKCRW